jgi:hypothetical protein
MTDYTAEKASSHQLIHLNYDVEKRIFTQNFVSARIVSLICEVINKTGEKRMLNFLNNAKMLDGKIYGGLYEGYVNCNLEIGCEGICRLLNDSVEKTENHKFPKCTVKYFKHVENKFFQTWYDESSEDGEFILGGLPINENVLLCQVSDGCSTIDSIRIIPSDNQDCLGKKI